MSDYKIHPAAAVFPMMPDADLDALAADIKAHGLIHPVLLLGNEVIDGRNRLAACKLAGVAPVYKELSPKPADVFEYVMAANVHRRHLTDKQRAACGAELATMKQGGDRKSEKIKPPIDGLIPTVEKVAKDLKVSKRSIERAKKVLKENPEQHERVKRGEKPEPKPKAPTKKKPVIVISKRTQQMDEPQIAHDITDNLDRALDRGGLLSPKVQGQLIQLTKRAAYLSAKDRRALIAALRRVAAMAEKHAAAHEKMLATK